MQNSPACTDSCTTTVLTTGLISVIITALLVAGISVIVHIAMFQCVYEPKMKTNATVGCAGHTDDVGGSLVPRPSRHSQEKSIMGTRLVSKGGDTTVYDNVDKGIKTAALEMKETFNEAYGLVTRS